ncbi:hypothetical protein, partial [Haemophilus influenzae]|uniref:hypothetical protein n=1 Tax=Haemophilus influenzae TaxID=727 RepID=UPI0013A69429
KEEEKEKDKDKEKEKQATTSIKTYYQFLLGLRTPSSEIPKEGMDNFSNLDFVLELEVSS